eukprot:363968-Chlamydomonas_euryale.AAC.9
MGCSSVDSGCSAGGGSNVAAAQASAWATSLRLCRKQCGIAARGISVSLNDAMLAVRLTRLLQLRRRWQHLHPPHVNTVGVRGNGVHAGSRERAPSPDVNTRWQPCQAFSTTESSAVTPVLPSAAPMHHTEKWFWLPPQPLTVGLSLAANCSPQALPVYGHPCCV